MNDPGYIDDRDVTAGDIRRIKDFVVVMGIFQSGVVLLAAAVLASGIFVPALAAVGGLYLLTAFSFLSDGYIRHLVGLVYDHPREPLSNGEFGEGSDPRPRGDD